MPLTLENRIAVITGAANGIGRALALQAAKDGMHLALADKDQTELSALAATLRAQGVQVLAETVDVRSRAALDEFAAATETLPGDIALVFVNAGVMRAGKLWQTSPEDWDLVLDVNLKGAVHTASAFIPVLLQQQNSSRIVFTGSTSAFSARPNLPAYSASKHALLGLAEALHLELAEIGANVAVSFLAPSGVKTSIADAPDTPALNAIGGLLQAFGMPPEDLAAYAFQALKDERYWILPHSDFKAALEKRTANIVTERDPAKP